MFFEKKYQAEEELDRIYVVAAIFVRENPQDSTPQILACQRGYGKWKGWWEFPGGKIEPGESDQEALCREILEEMETDIQILRYYDTLNYRYDDFLMTMHLYLCKLDGDQFVLNDHSEARWLDQHNLDTVRWLPADIELVSRWGSQGFDF
ncbi:MAG: (deoxy)nucleoside triphosphate pyrophosphohydrolase [Bacteroidales bacterium]|nr:(deoxy)nucleoside triphosphate pyrophosphohydrolase [Bacteroidales bacterium]MBR3986696.1 (deoxy)nucleoside triphosphate pyrophosphohydrolase [Bacteroidales bacterium]